MRFLRQAPIITATIVVSLLWFVCGLQPSVPGTLERVPDTISHAFAYSILGFLASGAASVLGLAAAPVWGWLYAAGHGGVLELLQLLVPTRTAQWRDLLADGIGAALGVSAALAWKRW